MGRDYQIPEPSGIDQGMNEVQTEARQAKGDFGEAVHVDEEYEYLLKNEDQGITFEEYCRRRGIRL